MKPKGESALPKGLRTAAFCVIAGYASLLASLMLRKAVALTILIPLGGLLILIAIFLWARAAFIEARSRGMV